MAEPTSSKELILLRINSEKGYAHFTRWKEFEKAKAIGDCGLAKHKYPNKSKRNEVLKQLFSADLPLDAEHYDTSPHSVTTTARSVIGMGVCVSKM